MSIVASATDPPNFEVVRHIVGARPRRPAEQPLLVVVRSRPRTRTRLRLVRRRRLRVLQMLVGVDHRRRTVLGSAHFGGVVGCLVVRLSGRWQKVLDATGVVARCSRKLSSKDFQKDVQRTRYAVVAKVE